MPTPHWDRPVTFAISGPPAAERAELQAQGQQLGAVYQQVLNHSVTHLVSDTVLSAKYLAAVSNQMPVVHPDWVRASATRGALQPEASYLLPPFYGLTVVVTGDGFTHEVRDHIARTVADLGGTLAPQLTFECTHLVAESVKASEKLLACCANSQLAHIRVVSCAWLEACMRTGVCVEDGPYLMTRFEPCLSSCVLAVARSSASSDQAEELARSAASVGATRVERIGLTVTHILFGDLACADPTRFVADANALVASAPSAVLVTAEWLLECERTDKLVPTASFLWRTAVERERERLGPSALPAPSAAPAHHHHHRDQPQHQHHTHHPAVSSHQPHVASSSTSHHPPPAPAPAPAPAPPPAPARAPAQPASSRTAAEPAEPSSLAALVTHGRLGARTASRGYFEGWCVLQVLSEGAVGLDETRTRALREAVSHGGLRLLCDSVPSDVDQWVEHDGPAAVLAPHGPDGLTAARRRAQELHEHRLGRRHVEPHDYARDALGRVASSSSSRGAPPACVSLQWLADCVRARKCLSPSAHPLYTPCAHRLPLSTFRELEISISQYEPNSDERRLAIDVIKLLGARYKENFRRGRSHLICPHITGEKCDRAAEWAVPMVTASWLKDCFEAGQQVPIETHHQPGPMDAGLAPHATGLPAASTAVPPPRVLSDDGAGAEGGKTSPQNAASSAAAAHKTTPPPKQSPAHRRDDNFPTEVAAEPPAGLFAVGAPPPRPALPAAPAALPARLSARPAMALRPGFLSASAPAPKGAADTSSSRLGGRSDTVADAEALLAQLPVGNQLEACTKAPIPLHAGGSSSSSNALVSASAAAVRRPVRRAELEGGGAGDVTTFNHDPASQPAQEVRYVDPEQREAQERLRSRMLASPEPDQDDAYDDDAHHQHQLAPLPPRHHHRLAHNGSHGTRPVHMNMVGVDEGAVDDDDEEEEVVAPPAPAPRAAGGGLPVSASGNGAGAPPAAASTGNMWSAAFARGQGGTGSAGERKPLRQKTLAVIGSGARAVELAEMARRLGASVIDLVSRQGKPQAVPPSCSAAVFASLAHVDASYASLAVLAAGLVPLKPSYLEQLSPSAREPLPERAHEWVGGEERADAAARARVRALLSLARRQQSGTRLFEKWRVALLSTGGSTSQPAADAADAPVRCRLSEAEVIALLSSGGAVLEPVPSEADAILVPDADRAVDAPPSVPRITLDEWMRVVVGDVASIEDLRSVGDPHEHADGGPDNAPASVISRGGRAGGAAPPPAEDGGSKRRTRHSASDPKPQAPSMKRQRAPS